jgi:hypothetical protein
MIPAERGCGGNLAGWLQSPRVMVNKFVFVPGPEPRLSPRAAVRASSAGKAMQWVLLGAALAVSAIAFSAAKTTFDRQAGHAAAQR